MKIISKYAMYLLIDNVSSFIEILSLYEINLFHELYHFHSIKNGIKQIIDESMWYMVK